MFTKQHFQVCAEMCATIKDEEERKDRAEWLASNFASSNPRFDRDRFMVACNAATRKQELRVKLDELYERSRKAIHKNVIREYERQINLLESEIAIIME